MIQEFQLVCKDKGEVTILSCSGYLNATGGANLWKAVEMLLQKGRQRLVIDLAGCTGINSLGVSEIIRISLLLVRDFRRNLVLMGLDDLKRKVFLLAGILQDALEAETEEEAIRLASS